MVRNEVLDTRFVIIIYVVVVVSLDSTKSHLNVKATNRSTY